jgi:succinate dehydrogenase / fumarate reductase, iron-sulfur subunit
MADPDKKGTARATVRLRVVRQDAPDKPGSRRTEEFEIPHVAAMTVHDCLEAVRKNPESLAGGRVAPVAWEAPCLEESCGACTMLINGVARLACSTTVASVSPKGQPIMLAPLSKLRVERDLIVDKSPMVSALERVHAWVTLGDMRTRAAIPRESQEQQLRRFELSACIGCGACLEACPEYQPNRPFVGAAAINRAHSLNQHTSGAMEKRKRVRSLMQDGGVADCGKAQACVDVCPKQIPLTESISKVARDATKEMLWGWLAD